MSSSDPKDANVFTISRASDFRDLCDRFGSADSQGPPTIDWPRVAETYHAVHLTFTGLILSQGVPVETRLGTMMLRGWDSESTAWLRLPPPSRLGRHFAPA
ncbi:hypothetical protein GCM10009716_35810 [Streptomyces sodiiphilus]|uniref:Uncharacterized protein n=1 Tax=Streptomyces sodiiphilus TaxID=226217 RepID=A0ABN2PKP5_9ACTN